MGDKVLVVTLDVGLFLSQFEIVVLTKYIRPTSWDGDPMTRITGTMYVYCSLFSAT